MSDDDRPDASKHGSKSISDDEMRSFQSFLRAWVDEHCKRPTGGLLSQREIAARLGITNSEFSSWMNDRARPGITRLIVLRETMGQSIDAMLGYATLLPVSAIEKARLETLGHMAVQLCEALREAGIQFAPSTKVGRIVAGIERCHQKCP